MGPVTLLVGRQVRDDWDLQEISVTAEVREQRGTRTLYELADGRFLMHEEADGISDVYEVSSTGHKVVDLEDYL